MTLLTELLHRIPQIAYAENEPLSAHTSFRIGGAAALMLFPQDLKELAHTLTACSDCGVSPRLLGAGTNVLAPDAGVDTAVICTKDALCGLELHGSTVSAMAGESLAKTAVFARDHGLSGLEFAHGIPGTVGGGVYMNAGAYDGCLADVCTGVAVMLPDGTLREYHGKELFSYRSSIFQSMDCVIVRAEFALTSAPQEKIRGRMQELMERRRASQPLELPSAGSTFKRPKGNFAGTLIQQAGLKGKRIGGACVSEKHAGFIVNTGGATAADVKTLIKEVQNQVLEFSGVLLEPEIRIW